MKLLLFHISPTSCSLNIHGLFSGEIASRLERTASKCGVD